MILTAHLNKRRPRWTEDLLTDSTVEGVFTFNEKSRNTFGWLEWVVMLGREFSFV